MTPQIAQIELPISHALVGAADVGNLKFTPGEPIIWVDSNLGLTGIFTQTSGSTCEFWVVLPCEIYLGVHGRCVACDFLRGVRHIQHLP